MEAMICGYFENGQVLFSRIRMENPHGSSDCRVDGVYSSTSACPRQGDSTLIEHSSLGKYIWLKIWSSLSTDTIIPCPQYSGTCCLDKYKVPPIFSSWVSKCTSSFAAATYRDSPTKTKCLPIVFLLLRLLPVPWRARWGWSQPLLCRYFYGFSFLGSSYTG